MCLCFPAGAAAQGLRAGRAAEPIHLDGRLTEAAWLQADSIDGLTEVEPVAGRRPASRTVVRVLVTDRDIYIGIVATNPPGVRTTSYSKARDSEIDQEDYLGIVFDTFRDGRSGYVFAVNPNGARVDGLVSGRGENMDESWDAIWDVKTTRGDSGWTAEFQIPIKSLIFRPGLEEWGFNVEREVQATREKSRWISPSPDVEITQTSRAGVLEGLPDFDLGLGLSVRPAVAVGGSRPAPDSSFTGKFHPSLDVTQRVGGDLLAHLTVNTDFAETEVDTRRTNLTRFPLFFPEKRSFFLEGSDIFEFGLGTGNDVRP
ncbi:MAG TPA: carbohydrate binding family 9 domain-containing protein, partial [Gemmatimonadales bacterium]